MEVSSFDATTLEANKEIDLVLKDTENKKKKLAKVLEDINLINNKNRTIMADYYSKYIQEEDSTKNIRRIHDETMLFISELGIYIWRSYSSIAVYYRINPFGKKVKIRTDDDFYALIQEDIRVYDTMDEVQIYDNTLLLIKSLLPMCKDDIFFPHHMHEIIWLNNYNYRNTFEYSRYLAKGRYRLGFKVGIILKFLFSITNSNSEVCDYIVDWLICFFQTKKKINTALVLIGDSEVSNILIEQIIRPIFAYNKEHFASIDDDILKKPNETIIKDKIFYHIGELSEKNITNKKTSELVMDILKPNRYYPEEAIKNNETYVWGQLIVTAEKETPFPFLKDSYSQCSVFRIKNMETILKELNVDRIAFKLMIQNDLDNFSNMLAEEQYDDLCINNIFNTPEKNALSTMKNGTLLTPQLNKNIEIFIKNIKEKNLDYFKKIKTENLNMFEELEYNFKENMITQQLLSEYFNLVNSDIFFCDNSDFLNILKEKSEIFRKTPDDKSKHNSMKRYTIVS